MSTPFLNPRPLKTPVMPENLQAESHDEDTAACVFVISVQTPPLTLEVFEDPVLTKNEQWLRLKPDLLQKLERLWPLFSASAAEAGVFEILNITPGQQQIEIELSWTGNDCIQAMNRDYRHKDTATDVLTFTLLADSPNPSLWTQLPCLQMGSIFVSVEWAVQVCTESGESLEAYLLERLIHGFLHLHGQHHDTMPAFDKVVGVQKAVLQKLLANV